MLYGATWMNGSDVSTWLMKMKQDSMRFDENTSSSCGATYS